MQIQFYIIFCCALGVLSLFLIYRNYKISGNLEILNSEKINDDMELTKLKIRLDEQMRINDELKARQVQLDAQTREYFDLKTKEMSQNLLNLNIEKIGENSQSILANIINPLKEEIIKYQKESQLLGTTFKINFDSLKEMTGDILNQASNLAEALRGNKKMLGNWGEMQLDNVLAASGLELNINYQKQVAYKDKEGKQKFLDAVVNFDETKKAIIDAKCSLVNYVDYFNATNEADKERFAKELTKDIRRHIDSLNAKEYNEYDKDTYEYVFMFIPNDNIFYTALNTDFTLYEYAYERGIFITTPLTLLMALRTVNLCWKNIKSDENARKIIEEASNIYDKFSVMIAHFDKLQRSIKIANDSLDELDTTFRNGRGNLFLRFENLKKLGIRTVKKLPQDYDRYDNENPQK